MAFELDVTDSMQSSEFDIDLRLGAADGESNESPQILTRLCSSHCPTNSSTCSHTTPRLCC